MIRVALLLGLLVAAPPPFTQFTYCRTPFGGSFESLCIQLNPTGGGETRFKRRGGEDLKFGIMLSAGGTNQFLNILAGTKYLANSKDYESKKRVANLGSKHLTLENGAERREAEFNYSELKEVNALVTFFEEMLAQESMAVDLAWAMQFDRLAIPDRLDQLEAMVKPGHVADPKSLMDILDAINRDDRILNYARTHARALKDKLAAMK